MNVKGVLYELLYGHAAISVITENSETKEPIAQLRLSKFDNVVILQDYERYTIDELHISS